MLIEIMLGVSSSYLFSFPLSAIIAAVMCGLVYFVDQYFRASALYKFLTGRLFSVILMILIVASMAVEGTWSINVQHSYPFYVLVLIVIFTVGLCIVKSIREKCRRSFILVHSGLFLILFGGFFGAPDFESAYITVPKGYKESYAVTPEGLTFPLAFGMSLDEFEIEYYDDGTTPKQFRSILSIYDDISDSSDIIVKKTSVNKPCLHHGFLIYQSDYDKFNGEYSVIKLVRDPWFPIVFAGMLAISAGALYGLRKTWKSKWVLPIAAVLAVVCGLISMAKINLGILPPALRSIWFVPHLIIYMLAYSLLAISLICGIISLLGKKAAGEMSLKLLGTSSTLLLVGMLCGAVWAKVAWGDYWTWDAKECWAAATWFLTLIGTHMNSENKHKILVFTVLLAFLAMQITWYGVNYLPSAQFSMHTYNT